MGRGSSPKRSAATPTAPRAQGDRGYSEPVEAMREALFMSRELPDIADYLRIMAAAAARDDETVRSRLNAAVNHLKYWSGRLESTLFLQLRDYRARAGDRAGKRLSPGDMFERPPKFRSQAEGMAGQARDALGALSDRTNKMQELSAFVAHAGGSLQAARAVTKVLKSINREIGEMRQVMEAHGLTSPRASSS